MSTSGQMISSMQNREPRLTFVRKIVTKAEHKFRSVPRPVAVLSNEPLCNLSLVDKSWADLEIGLSCHYLHVVLFRNSTVKVLLALSRLECTIFWIGSPVVPRESNFLSLDE